MIMPVRQLFIVLLISSLWSFTYADDKKADTSLSDHLLVWKEKISSDKGGDAYRILLDSASWNHLLKGILENWGDLGSRQGVSNSSVKLVNSLSADEIWDGVSIPMVLGEQQRIDALRHCVVFHMTDKVLYPQSYSYEKQTSYILKKYLIESNGIFQPSKNLQKILAECKRVFRQDIANTDAQIAAVYTAYVQKEEERKAAERVAEEERIKRFKEKQFVIKKPAVQKHEHKKTSYFWQGQMQNWMLYTLELVVFMMVVGVIMWPTLRREERDAKEEKRAKQQEILGRQRSGLMAKYYDMAIVNKIMSNQYWQGQTREQLIDALGRPDETDSYVMNAEQKETYKYRLKARRGFKLLVFLDNGIVVGWETL